MRSMHIKMLSLVFHIKYSCIQPKGPVQPYICYNLTCSLKWTMELQTSCRGGAGEPSSPVIFNPAFISLYIKQQSACMCALARAGVRENHLVIYTDVEFGLFDSNYRHIETTGIHLSYSMWSPFDDLCNNECDMFLPVFILSLRMRTDTPAVRPSSRNSASSLYTSNISSPRNPSAVW